MYLFKQYNKYLSILTLFTGIGLSQGFVFEFNNCGQTGPTGPSQGQCDSAYFESGLEVNVNNYGVQEWTAPYDGTFLIDAGGAQGANNGGYGARMQGEFYLYEDEIINIVVGQMGIGYNGGGGGTFIYRLSNSELLIAAGGGSGYPGNSGGSTSENGLGSGGGNRDRAAPMRHP